MVYKGHHVSLSVRKLFIGSFIDKKLPVVSVHEHTIIQGKHLVRGTHYVE